MKFLFIYLLLLLNATSYSQIRVTYSVEIVNNEDREISKIEKSAIDNAKYLQFELIIDNYEANFFLINTMHNDIDRKGLMYAKSLTLKSFDGYYINSKDKKHYFKYAPNPIQDLNKYLIVGSMNKSWKLSKETKMINGYKVYRADGITTEMKSNTSNIEAPPKEYEIPIVAWYSPEINTPFGPIGIGDLPGLILELNYGEIKYKAEKIDFNYKLKKGIKVFDKGEEIDRNSYVTLATKKAIERMKELGINLNQN